MDRVRIFIDANIFIEMHDLNALDWLSLLPGARDICIVVSMHVVKELDKLKNDRTERRRRRARLALKQIDEASRTGGKVLRSEPYRLTLVVSHPAPHDWDRYPLLDRTEPDDRLIVHLIEDGNAILVSDDTGPRIKATMLGVGALAAPATFRLKPEESAEQKKVRELTADIKLLKDQRPKMRLKLGRAPGDIVLPRPVLHPLPQVLQDEVVGRILRANPKEKRPTALSSRLVVGVSAKTSDWARYDAAYASYAHAVRRHAASIHERFNGMPIELDVPFEIINSGQVTVINADVIITLSGNARLAVRDLDDEDSESDDDTDVFELSFPNPPRLGQADNFASMRFRSSPVFPRLRIGQAGSVTFRWAMLPDEERPGRAVLSNREFRVGKRHLDTISIVPTASLPLDLKLCFELEATDLASVDKQEFSVRVEAVEREWLFGDIKRLERVLPPKVEPLT